MNMIKCPCCEAMIEIHNAGTATESDKAIVLIMKDKWDATEYLPRWSSFGFKSGTVLKTSI